MGKNEATTFIFDDCCAMGSDKLELDMTNVLEVSFSRSTSFSEACISELLGAIKKKTVIRRM
jgi:hypothetical protein